jgi:SH3-like domain-containing protein
MKRKSIFILIMTLFFLSFQVLAEDSDEGKKASGLPVPRFASLRSNNVNMRTGPGTRYPIEWVYSRQGLPVEIIAEYEIWRRVRDPEGAEGWVHKTELSGSRTVVITSKSVDLLESSDDKSETVAHLENGSIGQISSCSTDWCKLKFQGNIKGYTHKTALWGVYANEIVK